MIYQTIIDLHEILDKLKIEHEFKSWDNGFQIVFYRAGKRWFDFIQNRFSQGGNEGYLEAMGEIAIYPEDYKKPTANSIEGYISLREALCRILQIV